MAILVVAGQGRINWCNETTLPLLSIAASRGPVCVTLQPHRACWNLWFWQQNGRHATIEEVLSLIWTLQPTLQQPKALMKLCTPNRLYHECYMIVVFDFNNVITCNHHWYDAPTGVPTTSLTAPSSSHEKIDVWWKTTLTTAISDVKWQHRCKRETSHHDDNYLDLGTESLKRDDLAITS